MIHIIFILYLSIFSVWAVQGKGKNGNYALNDYDLNSSAAPPTFDCVAREFVWQYAQLIQPWYAFVLAPHFNEVIQEGKHWGCF